MRALEDDVISEPEACILAQEDLNEQIRSYNVPLNKQLEDWTRRIHGKSFAQQPNLYPTVGTSASLSELLSPNSKNYLIW